MVPFRYVQLNPCLSDPGFIFFLKINVDPDQLASDKATWSGSTLFSSLIENSCL